MGARLLSAVHAARVRGVEELARGEDDSVVRGCEEDSSLQLSGQGCRSM